MHPSSLRLLRVTLAFVGLSCLVACGSNSPGPVPRTLAEVKSDSWRDLVGEPVELEGYLMIHADGTGVLVQSPEDTSTNTLIPESRYVALSGSALRSLAPESHYMAKVRVSGVVKETADPDRRHLVGIAGDKSLCEVAVDDGLTILQPWTGEIAAVFDPCAVSGLCDLVVRRSPQKFALLYSGGINKDAAYMRYWNDMTLYYAMLTFLFGYQPENVVVVYKDGMPENGFMPVDHPATPAGLNAAFTDLRNRMTSKDEFFFFMTNHGGTIADAGSPTPNDEDFSADTIDECAFYYNVDSVPYDDDIAMQVNSLSFSRMCCVMEQCFSGGMIYDLRGPNRVIVTACNEVEVSYGGAVYDDFVMLFASALIGIQQLTGDPVDADEDNDGKVSVYEAFRWATTHDTRPETPQYEDSGEGIPIAFPAAGITTDGSYGSLYFL